MASKSRGTWIAIAGITATAIVGLAGTITSWLVSREDRAQQRRIAHEARVFERRADTYAGAIAVLETLRRDSSRFAADLTPGQPRPVWFDDDMNTLMKEVQGLHARWPSMLAFASAKALAEFRIARFFAASAANSAISAAQEWTNYPLDMNIYKRTVELFEQTVRRDLR